MKYNEPLSRWAYCFAQVPANANLIKYIIFHFAVKDDDFREAVLEPEHVSFCAIGGGPGTELLGVAKFYKEYAKFGEEKDIEVKILDVEPGWQENLVLLRAGIRQEMKQIYIERRNYPFNISHTFSLVNTRHENSFANYANLVAASVVICSYFLSEVFDLGSLQPLVEAMKVAADDRPYYLLLIDRSDVETRSKVEAFLAMLGATKVLTTVSNARIDNDEQKSELQRYSDIIIRMPRTTWQASAVLAKVG